MFVHRYGKIGESGRRKRRLAAIAAVVLAGLLLYAGYRLGNLNGTVIVYRNETKSAEAISFVPYVPVKGYQDSSFSYMAVPAVGDDGSGLTAVLTVQIIPGSGKVLANIDRLLFWTDTQSSIQTSARVASDITATNLSMYDIVYTIETDADSVEGPSAGAALAIATVAALSKRQTEPGVLITGTVDQNGTIGPVSQILQKAKAARETGAKLLLVPPGQSSETVYETREYCGRPGPDDCSEERVPVKVDVAEEAGIRVVEVASVSEALKYVFAEEA